MSKREIDDHSGVETTGHEWDGIKELNHPLPKWWLYILYGSIIWSFGYWVAYPAWPTLNSYTHGILKNSDRARVTTEVAALKSARAPMFAKMQATPIEQVKSNEELFQFAQEAGKSTFNDNCATCHGAGGQGNKGFPSLVDDVWIWDGTYEGIRQTINFGIRSGHDQARISAMPAFGRDGMLDAGQAGDVTEYVMSLSKMADANAGKAARGAAVYAANCVVCHGATGGGDVAQGAPNLTDAEWLYGGSRADIAAQIHNGRGGVMPAWSAKLDPETVTALTVYVHSLGGGK